MTICNFLGRLEGVTISSKKIGAAAVENSKRLKNRKADGDVEDNGRLKKRSRRGVISKPCATKITTKNTGEETKDNQVVNNISELQIFLTFSYVKYKVYYYEVYLHVGSLVKLLLFMYLDL